MQVPTLSFGELDTTWERYDLSQGPLLFNGNHTGYKAVLRKGQIVSIVRKGYALIPNEEAVKLADEAAELAGLVPFHEFSGEWIVKMHEHVIYDKNETRVHALYASNKHYDVNGEKMHIGVGIHNSIDGSMAFGCGIFTFRHACANMVFAGTRGYEQAFDQRKTVEYIYKRHTASLAPITGGLKNTILAVMDKATSLIDVYNQMAQEKVTQKFIERLKKSRLSARVLPDYLTAKEPETFDISSLTQWQLYNDITEKIWHNAKAHLKTKEFQFATLHKLMPLQVTQ